MSDATQININTQEAFDKQQKGFDKTLTSLKNKLQVVFMETMLPALEDISSTMKDPAFINGLTVLVDSLAKISKMTFGTFADFIGLLGEFEAKGLDVKD